jgi:hypothetical protein
MLKIYHDTYPTKNIWNDINVVELLSLKGLADSLVEGVDGIQYNLFISDDFLFLVVFVYFLWSSKEWLTDFDMLSQLNTEKVEADKAEALAAEFNTNKMFRILCFNYLILNNIFYYFFPPFSFLLFFFFILDYILCNGCFRLLIGMCKCLIPHAAPHAILFFSLPLSFSSLLLLTYLQGRCSIVDRIATQPRTNRTWFDRR